MWKGVMMIRAPEPIPTPTEVHDGPCNHCPSFHYPPDPESEEIANGCLSGKYAAADCVFPCAWRPEKICYGVAVNCGLIKEDV